MQVKAFGATDVGRVRAANEDSFLIDDERKLYIVADGMGGHQGGGYASSHAVASIREEIINQEQKQESTQPVGGGQAKPQIQIRLRNALVASNEKLFNKALEDSSLRGMGTTVTAAQLDHAVVNIAHVGDSRAYVLRDGALTQITRDHSWVQEQVDAGLLTMEEAESHPLKNIITRSLGHDREIVVDLLAREYKAGDKYLLCSDGLTNMVDDEAIMKLMSGMDPEPCVKKLVEMANEAGGQDNITALMIEIKD
jgi:protein phosphatase